jgi:hypothetical protein
VESLVQLVPFWVIVAIGLCLIVLAVSAGLSLFMLLFKAGVVFHEARKPPHMDTGDYRLDQGREVRPEGTVRRETEDTGR